MHDPHVEWVVFGYICVEQAGRRAAYPCCVGYDLCKLPTGSIGEWTEVWPVLVIARLTFPTTRIPTHETMDRETVDPYIESVGTVYICVDLGTWIILQVGSITHHLGYLTTGNVIPRTECAICIP